MMPALAALVFVVFVVSRCTGSPGVSVAISGAMAVPDHVWRFSGAKAVPVCSRHSPVQKQSRFMCWQVFEAIPGAKRSPGSCVVFPVQKQSRSVGGVAIPGAKAVPVHEWRVPVHKQSRCRGIPRCEGSPGSCVVSVAWDL